MSTLPRRDRWVVTLVVLAIASLIAGFAASAPALRREVAGEAEVATTQAPSAGELPGAASPITVRLDAPAAPLNVPGQPGSER